MASSELSADLEEGYTIDMLCAVSNDGYLYGAVPADDCENAVHKQYWSIYWSDPSSTDDWAVVRLKDVPFAVAERLVRVGTSEQDFSDGYQAWGAAAKYKEK